MSDFPRFEVFLGSDGKFYWQLVATTDVPILSGRGYKTKHESLKAISDVIKFSGNDQCFIRKDMMDIPLFSFYLKSPAGKTFAWSGLYRLYHAEKGRDAAIEKVKEACKGCTVIDTTL